MCLYIYVCVCVCMCVMGMYILLPYLCNYIQHLPQGIGVGKNKVRNTALLQNMFEIFLSYLEIVDRKVSHIQITHVIVQIHLIAT